jgi:hypothetical protein
LSLSIIKGKPKHKCPAFFMLLFRFLMKLSMIVRKKLSRNNLVHGTYVEETKFGFLERNSASDDPQFHLIWRVRRGKFQREI